jgi:hypothetical protein
MQLAYSASPVHVCPLLLPGHWPPLLPVRPDPEPPLLLELPQPASTKKIPPAKKLTSLRMSSPSEPMNIRLLRACTMARNLAKQTWSAVEAYCTTARSEYDVPSEPGIPDRGWQKRDGPGLITLCERRGLQLQLRLQAARMNASSPRCCPAPVFGTLIVLSWRRHN